MKKKVLILTSYYLPSIKGGGPIQSIKNLVDNISDKIDFYIITSDRDLGNSKPFNDIKVDEWSKVGNAQVFYTNPYSFTWKKIAATINSIDYDFLYLNSFFSYKFSIVPMLLRKFNKIRKKPIIIAPRGEFSPGALALKRRKKKLFISICKLLNIYKNVIWHATVELEEKHIQTIFGKKANIKIANNLTSSNYIELNYKKRINKSKGELKVIFLSRIHPKKNLKKAIEFLMGIKGTVQFNIYGPIEDKKYWTECQKLIENLPNNISVFYKGIVSHEKVLDVFLNHHILLFPTLGENYGHVICEALIGGCPVIISDQTPWRELGKKKVGWDIPLTNERAFSSAIQYFVDLNETDYLTLSMNAYNFGKKSSVNKEDIINNINLFMK